MEVILFSRGHPDLMVSVRSLRSSLYLCGRDETFPLRPPHPERFKRVRR